MQIFMTLKWSNFGERHSLSPVPFSPSFFVEVLFPSPSISQIRVGVQGTTVCSAVKKTSSKPGSSNNLPVPNRARIFMALQFPANPIHIMKNSVRKKERKALECNLAREAWNHRWCQCFKFGGGGAETLPGASINRGLRICTDQLSNTFFLG